MPSLNINKQYRDTIPPSEAQLDAAFDSVATYFNITGLGGENIQDGAIGTTELAEGAITESKLVDVCMTAAKIADAAVTAVKLTQEVRDSLSPAGIIFPYSVDSAPSGWLLCDGTAVSRTTYAALFATVGVRFGQGDGVLTFCVPDFRGRFLRGKDGGSLRDLDSGSRTIMNTGGATGNAVGSVQDSDNVAHTHTTTEAFVNPFIAIHAGTALTMPRAEVITSTTSSNGGTEMRPINAAFNFIIKT